MWVTLFCIVIAQHAIHVSTQEYELPMHKAHTLRPTPKTMTPDEIVYSSIERVLNKTLRKVCILHDRLEAFGSVESAIRNSKGCVVGLTKNYTAAFEVAEINNDWDVKSKTYCRFATDLLGCLSGIFDATEGCMRPDQKGRLPKVINAGLDYVCYNDGKRFSDFIKVGGDYCLVRELRYIKGCIHTALPEVLSIGTAIDSGNVTIEDAQAEKCGVVLSMGECIMDKIDDCPEPKVYDFMDGFMDASIDVTPCRQYKRDSYKLVVVSILTFLVVMLLIVIVALTVFRRLKNRPSNQFNYNKSDL